ncbi:MAG TPA: type I DNA topoisomerase [Thermodesulfobacteriota bacterium]|nr:type I DNA topoisomerase [Thermodesulfobacteriota bacterium]
MPKSLVIVESPAKARTIHKYLGRDFIVKSSVGHIKDLPKNQLGVDIEHDFRPEYEVIRGKGKVLAEIKRVAREADAIYLAPDPDREGEAIAWHIAEELGAVPNGRPAGKGAGRTAGGRKRPRVYRVLFNEITKKAIQEAFRNPGTLNEARYQAQQARRILDRLVGYQISPLLWEKVKRGLSAGRVQSVALRLVVEREREIRAFKPQEYWSLTATLEGDSPPPFDARLVRIGEAKAELATGADAERVVAALDGATWTVVKVERKDRRRHPAPPFITSTLQQEAWRKLGFSAKKTMTLAQRLYEGVDLGDEGAVGLITYMRTDSTRIAADALAEARAYIERTYGAEFLPEEPNVYRSKKGAQDAHEAIRPTSLDWTPERVRPHLEPDLYRLYELIFQRFVACQMRPAVFDQTTVEVEARGHVFRATGSVVRFPGFMQVYIEGRDDDPAAAEEEGGRLPPDLAEGDRLRLLALTPQQHFTQPPPRYTEASLVKELEEKGIGRPSTYATILSNIREREYVTLEDRRLRPTQLGEIVTDLLVESFPEIVDVGFTADMEERLDQIEEGRVDWVEMLRDFYGPFQRTLERAASRMRDVKAQEIPTEIRCERCGRQMVIKWGRMGEFLACPGYPECKNTKEFVRDPDTGEVRVVEEVPTNETCPESGHPLVIKRGRFGRFLACAGYPECKFTKTITTGIACPVCGQGELAERRSRRGKAFYACNRYPDCTYAIWDRPKPVRCPQCDAPFLVEKSSKRTGPYTVCPKRCGYRSEGESFESTAEPVRLGS